MWFCGPKLQKQLLHFSVAKYIAKIYQLVKYLHFVIANCAVVLVCKSGQLVLAS